MAARNTALLRFLWSVRVMQTTAEKIAEHLWPGCRVAIGDGAGAPVGLAVALTDAARSVGGVELMLGWCFDPPVDLNDASAFPEVRTFMGGYALRGPISQGRVSYYPARVGALPALFSGPLRPDIVVLAARRMPRGFAYGTEASWLPAAVNGAGRVLIEANAGLPVGAVAEGITDAQAVVVAEVDRPPRQVRRSVADDESRAVAAHVARLIPAGSAIQFGPGRIADSVLDAIDVPVAVDSGVVGDAVLGLDARGLLLGNPTAAYVMGSPALYEWIDGRHVVRGIEYTHDISRLAARDFVAINTALEIDDVGQVNVERLGRDPVSGVGGHGDYAMAASRSARGLSIVALSLAGGGRSTLVTHLSAPVSTAYADIDVVVTANGSADLRGQPESRRVELIKRLWNH
jgi:acyl-CoA hydrolase